MTVFAIFALLVHEYGHLFAARFLGYSTGKIRLMPYGAALPIEEGLFGYDQVYVAAFGPIANLLTLTFVVTAWWFFPSSYAVLKTFSLQNAAILLVNLLPCYPLDGARIIIGLYPKFKRIAHSLTLVFACFVLLLFIHTLFFTPNVSILVFSAFLFAYYFFAPDGKGIYCIKQAYKAHEGCSVIYVISENAPLFKLIRLLSDNPNYLFSVQNKVGKEIARITSNEVYCLAEQFGATTPIIQTVGA